MIRHCNGSDPFLIARDGSGCCPCGAQFDDVDCSVIWPHSPLPKKLSESELRDLYRAVFGEELPRIRP
jgi:hypothetical protein